MGVSVIVPVRNDPTGISNVLDRLLECELPNVPVEIIIVDNGSTDNTQAVAAQYARDGQPSVRLVEESSTLGSYAARNKGLSVAGGEVLAFTDADCSPRKDWICEGTKPLLDDRADLVGGHVEFTFGPRVTGAELFDSISNMQIRYDIERRQVCKTANLFAKRACFEELGTFPAHLKSGGDVWWTGKAARAGFRLQFAPAAIVAHPARSWRDLMRKQARVGYAQIPVRKNEGRSTWWLIGNFWRLLKPPPKRRITNSIERNRYLAEKRHRRKAWWGCWVSRLATAWGQVRYVWDRQFKPSALDQPRHAHD